MKTFVTKRLLALALLTTASFAPAAYARQQAAPAPAAAPVRAERPRRAAAEPFARTELFFGTDREDGPDVTEAQFREFLDAFVTPEFPDGLTLLAGDGQFCCGPGGEVIREKSFVLILLYPQRRKRESGDKIEMIREAYKAAFQQQSVLRVDTPAPARVSF